MSDIEFVQHRVATEYAVPQPSAAARRFAERLAKGTIVGHRCSGCDNVYVPPRGYCALCVRETHEEVEVSPQGTVTSFTVITPIQYEGQQETDDYVQANVLLDRATQTIMTRLDGIPIADVRMGLRVEAEWLAEAERSSSPSGGLADAIRGWRATGEPDTPLDQFAHHIV